MVLKAVNSGYKVFSKIGRPLSKTQKSRKNAINQLRAVEASKARRNK